MQKQDFGEVLGVLTTVRGYYMGNKRHTVVVMEELSRPKLTSNNVSMFKPEAVSLPKFRIREIWTAMTDYYWNVHGNDVIQKKAKEFDCSTRFRRNFSLDLCNLFGGRRINLTCAIFLTMAHVFLILFAFSTLPCLVLCRSN